MKDKIKTHVTAIMLFIVLLGCLGSLYFLLSN